jgi:hypothetical protein
MHRAKYLLASEPAGAVAVLDARTSPLDRGDITVVGRIGGVADPWTKDRAAFVIADTSATGDADDGCTDACCQFCQQKKAAAPSLALVRFVDDDGRVLPIDARRLFGLTEHQTVVIRGQAKLSDVGLLVVAAKGMYVRR